MKQLTLTLFSVLVLSGLSPLAAQQYISEVSPADHFQQGMDLLDKKKYGAAREEFETYLLQAPNGAYATDAEYYAAYAAVRLYNPDGEAKLNEFVRDNRSNPKAIRANYELGNFYFRDEDYGKAIEAFEKTDARNLSREDEATRNFKLAYAYFSRKKFKRLSHYLTTLSDRIMCTAVRPVTTRATSPCRKVSTKKRWKTCVGLSRRNPTPG